MEKSFTAQLGAASLGVAAALPSFPLLCAKGSAVTGSPGVHGLGWSAGTGPRMIHRATGTPARRRNTPPLPISSKGTHIPFGHSPSITQLCLRPQPSVLPKSDLSVPPWTVPHTSSLALVTRTQSDTLPRAPTSLGRREEGQNQLMGLAV